MQKIDITIARLRLLLAELGAKEEQYAAMGRQFRGQLRRAIEYSIYGDASLDGTLGLMDEIQQRIAQAEVALRDLNLIRAKAERELESLQLTKRIEAAKKELAELLARQAELARLGADEPARSAAPEIGEQIERLRQQINEASEQAAKSLSNR